MRAAWIVIGVALVLASGCARRDWIDQTLVTVDVTGVWKGTTFGGVGGSDIELSLQQSGPKVTGDVRISGGNFRANGPIKGSVSGDMFRFEEQRRQVIGEVQVNGDEMVGAGHASVGGTSAPIRIELRRQQ